MTRSLVLLSLLAVCFISMACGADDSQLNTVGGLPSSLPSVPRQLNRSLQGSDQTLTTESIEVQAPLSSLIRPVRGNDAVIEVIVGQGRLLTTKKPLVSEQGDALIAVGDPTILDVDVLPNPRMIRVIGKRVGVSDLSVTSSEGETFSFEIHVIYDLPLLTAQIRQLFPDNDIRISQIREHLVVEGEVRTAEQSHQVATALASFLRSVQVPSKITGENERGSLPPGEGGDGGRDDDGEKEPEPKLGADAGGERPSIEATFVPGQIINLLRVPGVHQVLLKVRVAELNRTALRSIGSDLFVSGDNGTTLGTQIGGGQFLTDDDGFLQALGIGTNSTLFGVFPEADFAIVMEALRRNNVLSLLAEPNLMAMSGHQASFLAGGQFPVPVPQGGNSNQVTIQFKPFGVRLDFLPNVLDDETIRLNVEPEVSSIDFSIGTTLVSGGSPVPGVISRKASTTVELKQGQTLAIAGLLQVNLDAQTNRIPGLGDLPIIGTFFSNTSHERVEKELIVLVTPYLVAPVEEHEVAPLPGSDIHDPNDLELYLMGRIEGRTGREFRATTAWDRTCESAAKCRVERLYGCGPVGFSR